MWGLCLGSHTEHTHFTFHITKYDVSISNIMNDCRFYFEIEIVLRRHTSIQFGDFDRRSDLMLATEENNNAQSFDCVI